MSNITKKALYLSYDGLLEPLGKSQVFEYTKKLSKSGIEFTIISFEKKINLTNSSLLKELQSECSLNNIKWIPKIYRSYPFFLGTILNLIELALMLVYLIPTRKFQVIHLRGIMLGLSFHLLPIKIYDRLIADIRGFWPDEKADRAGWSRQGFLYKFFKHLEKDIVSKASQVIVLTNESKAILIDQGIDGKKITLIRTSSDKSIFKNSPGMKDAERKVLGYLGTTDTAYNFKKLAKFYSELIKQDNEFFLKIITRSNHNEIKDQLSKLGIKEEFYVIKSIINRSSLVNEINSFDLCVFYLNKNFSVKASMPTKISECLSCGIPIGCNEFNNDIAELLNNNSGLITNFNFSDLNDFIKRLKFLKSSSYTVQNCQEIFSDNFDLDLATEKYQNVYNRF